jgi:hypothetical protein
VGQPVIVNRLALADWPESGQQKTRRRSAKAGYRTAAALAEFITRPQAETQIGAR